MLEKLKLIRNSLIKLRKYYIPELKPTVITVDVDFIAKRLEGLPNFEWWRWLPLDGSYYTTTLGWFRKIIEWDRTNRHKYFLDKFDCDKYAMYLKANIAWYFGINSVAVVLDYSSQHAYNIVLPSDSEALILEPQTDELFKVSERNLTYYALKDYVIVL